MGSSPPISECQGELEKKEFAQRRTRKVDVYIIWMNNFVRNFAYGEDRLVINHTAL